MNNIMQKIRVIGLISLAVFFLAAASASAEEYASIKKDGTNIRSGPSTKSPILWEVFEGFPYKIDERKDDWAKVSDFEGDSGWIYSNLLSDKKTVIVKVDTANMRTEPDKDAPIVATVKKGVVFEVISNEGNWIKLKYKDNLTGWIYNTLLWPTNP